MKNCYYKVDFYFGKQKEERKEIEIVRISFKVYKRKIRRMFS